MKDPEITIMLSVYGFSDCLQVRKEMKRMHTYTANSRQQNRHIEADGLYRIGFCKYVLRFTFSSTSESWHKVADSLRKFFTEMRSENVAPSHVLYRVRCWKSTIIKLSLYDKRWISARVVTPVHIQLTV